MNLPWLYCNPEEPILDDSLQYVQCVPNATFCCFVYCITWFDTLNSIVCRFQTNDDVVFVYRFCFQSTIFLKFEYCWGHLESFLLILHIFDGIVIKKRTANNIHDAGNDLPMQDCSGLLLRSRLKRHGWLNRMCRNLEQQRTLLIQCHIYIYIYIYIYKCLNTSQIG